MPQPSLILETSGHESHVGINPCYCTKLRWTAQDGQCTRNPPASAVWSRDVDTRCRSGTEKGFDCPERMGPIWNLAGLGGFDEGFVHQHNRDVIPNRVNAVTRGALQAFSRLFAMQQGLFARRADQNVEQFLRNHANILTFFEAQPRQANSLDWRISGRGARARTHAPTLAASARLHRLGEERPH